jgi:WW domain-containing oxidoreductase
VSSHSRLKVSHMPRSIPFGSRSTADQVLAGVDLTRRRMVVVGCNRGIGFEAMKSLVANGAHVIGLARTLEHARAACAEAGAPSTPIACDLADLASIDSAADSICDLSGPLDAIVTNTDPTDLPVMAGNYGIELRFIAEYLGLFALVNRLTDRVRSSSGRIVMMSGDVTLNQPPTTTVTLDDLEARRFYEPLVSYGQAESAKTIYAKELSRRLASRSVSVNSFDSGFVGGAGFDRHHGWTRRLIYSVGRLFMKSAAQGAATAALLAASPLVAGISGECWSNCKITRGNPALADDILAKRFWETSEQTIAAIRMTRPVAPHHRLRLSG